MKKVWVVRFYRGGVDSIFASKQSADRRCEHVGADRYYVEPYEVQTRWNFDERVFPKEHSSMTSIAVVA